MIFHDIFHRCEATGFRFYVDGLEFTFYDHRLPPQSVNGLYISGRVKIYNVKYKSPKVIGKLIFLFFVKVQFISISFSYFFKVIILLRDMFWRLIGGHLRKIVSSESGIVWAISYDNTAYYYTNGWSGTFLNKGLTSAGEINAMTDTQNYYIYENQRWNPLTGEQ